MIVLVASGHLWLISLGLYGNPGGNIPGAWPHFVGAGALLLAWSFPDAEQPSEAHTGNEAALLRSSLDFVTSPMLENCIKSSGALYQFLPGVADGMMPWRRPDHVTKAWSKSHGYTKLQRFWKSPQRSSGQTEEALGNLREATLLPDPNERLARSRPAWKLRKYRNRGPDVSEPPGGTGFSVLDSDLHRLRITLRCTSCPVEPPLAEADGGGPRSGRSGGHSYDGRFESREGFL